MRCSEVDETRRVAVYAPLWTSPLGELSVTTGNAVQRESSPGTEVSITTPPGYRHSEIGLLPDDWEITTLGALGRPLSGGTPRTSEPRYWNGDIPWISSKDMKVSRLHDSIDHVTPLALGNGTRLVQPGTILMVVRGMSLAHSFPVAIVEKPIAFNQDLKAFVAKPGVDSEFVLRWLEFNQATLLLLATEATHGTKRIPTPDLLASHVPLPHPVEQREIAEVLSDVDGLLGALEALIDKKRAIKQAAMQQLLTGVVRLSGFRNRWKNERLSKLGTFFSGSGFPLAFQGHQSGHYPFFKVSDLGSRENETILRCANHWISEDARRTIGASKIPARSVVFAKIGAAIFLERKRILSQESCLDNNMMAFCLTASIACERFIYYLFLRMQLGKLASTTALPSLSSREIGATIVSLPPVKEQHAITDVLSDIDYEIAALERRREKMRAVKQGMMQQLLTGRVRLV